MTWNIYFHLNASPLSPEVWNRNTVTFHTILIRQSIEQQQQKWAANDRFCAYRSECLCRHVSGPFGLMMIAIAWVTLYGLLSRWHYLALQDHARDDCSLIGQLGKSLLLHHQSRDSGLTQPSDLVLRPHHNIIVFRKSKHSNSKNN